MLVSCFALDLQQDVFEKSSVCFCISGMAFYLFFAKKA